ncbi:PAS domain-containing protein [Rhizobium sp. BC49]|uniref:PAS domain-containing protein n=1 Tax=unclassified Rhizobium TaxID=2613769 RepID=UPI0031F314A6
MILEDLYRLLKSGQVQAQGIVDTMTQPIVVLDHNLCVVSANNAFVRTFEIERDDILGQSFFDLGNGQWEIAELRQPIASVIPKAAAVIGFEVTHDFPAIGQRRFSSMPVVSSIPIITARTSSSSSTMSPSAGIRTQREISLLPRHGIA